MQAVLAGTKFFAKMDALHGYFQLALDKPSSKIRLPADTDICGLLWDFLCPLTNGAATRTG